MEVIDQADYFKIKLIEVKISSHLVKFLISKFEIELQTNKERIET